VLLFPEQAEQGLLFRRQGEEQQELLQQQELAQQELVQEQELLQEQVLLQELALPQRSPPSASQPRRRRS